MQDFKKIKICRICNGKFYKYSLKLKPTPIANCLFSTYEEAVLAKRYPLEIVMCKNCKHIQLKYILKPELLFNNYVYASSTSVYFQNHFQLLANFIANNFDENISIVEIGSNDGYLLRQLNNHKFKVFGIEPSKILADMSRCDNITIVNDYLNKHSVNNILLQNGQVDLVIGNNVFAHIDNLKESFSLVNNILKNNGSFIFEVNNFNKIVELGYFDTIYHEHYSYHTITGLLYLIKSSGFSIDDVQEIDTHGASFRFILKKTKNFYVSETANILLQKEIISTDMFKLLKRTIKNKKHEYKKILKIYKNCPIVGYGAPAKLITFIYQLGYKKFPLSKIIDDNKLKQNKYIGGLGLEITQTISGFSDTVFIIFPWNVSGEIKNKINNLKIKNSKILSFYPTVQIKDVA